MTEGEDTVLNRRVAIFFNDGETISRKDGIVLGENTDFVFLRTVNGQQLISKDRIIRIEIFGR